MKYFLGRLWFPGDSTCWTYDATTGKRWSAIPEETCVQTHFYSAERKDGTMDTRLEEFLSQVEGRAAPVYEVLLKGRMPGGAERPVLVSRSSWQ